MRPWKDEEVVEQRSNINSGVEDSKECNGVLSAVAAKAPYHQLTERAKKTFNPALKRAVDQLCNGINTVFKVKDHNEDILSVLKESFLNACSQYEE